MEPCLLWPEIDTVLLDLDGTLLDKYFDDYFWETFVPTVFAAKNNLDLSVARMTLLDTYKKVEETLQWTDLDYWSDELCLNIPMLKREIAHLIAVRPEVTSFLEFLKENEKEIFLVTNAHPKTLEVKFEHIEFTQYFTDIFSSKEVGAAKEQAEFWPKLNGLLPFTRDRTLFVDDTEKVLQAARNYGIFHLIHIANPSSKLTPVFSPDFPSIISFQELM
ncbi:MAG: HAD-IA family hydrolase [Deltaproteobacteria bacterium]|nr:HAD-IA family hydrolase [Deltaproteobacteria bacterium]